MSGNIIHHGKAIDIYSELALEIARGNIKGAEPFGAFGKKITVGAEPISLLWANGDWTIPVTAGEQIRLVSTSPEDGVNGTGIRSIHMHYLDANLAPQSEEIILNGTTAVVSTATTVRFIQCAHLDTYGSSKKAVGKISFTNLAGTSVYNEIGIGEVRCTSSARMVPANKRAVVVGLVGSSISGTSASSALINIGVSYFYGHDYTEDAILIPIGTTGVQDNGVPYNLPIPHIAPAGTIIGMTCQTDGKATITGDWFGWIEDIPQP